LLNGKEKNFTTTADKNKGVSPHLILKAFKKALAF